MLTVLAVTALAGCANRAPVSGTPRATPPKAPRPAAAEPKRTGEADEIGRLVASWRSQGLKAEAQYTQGQGRAGDLIEWQSVEVFLGFDVQQAERVSNAVGQFAARASRPVLISLYVRNRKQDSVLSQALKQGALASGGRNSVKLDHYIGPEYAAKIRLTVRDGR